MILAIIYIPILIIAKLRYYLLGKRTSVTKKDVTIVITGAKMYKSAMFVKWLGKAGYRIILVETEKFWCSGTRFSKYVEKFYTVSCAINKPDQYVSDMLAICKNHKADWFIPACAPATEKLDSIVASFCSSESDSGSPIWRTEVFCGEFGDAYVKDSGLEGGQV